MPNAIIAIAKPLIFCYLSSNPYEKKASIGVGQRHSFSSSFYGIFFTSVLFHQSPSVAHPSNALNIKSQNLLKI